MNNKVKYGLYALFGLAAVLVSLYVRFPSDTLRSYAARQMERLVPGLEVAVAAVRLSWPAAVQLQGIEARYENRPVLTLDRARLSPAWGEVVRFSPAWQVTAEVGSGRLRALIRDPENDLPSTPTLLADLDGIDLGKLQGLQRLIGRRIAGLCSGTVFRSQEGGKSTVALRLQITEAAVDLKQPILQRAKVLLHSVQAEAEMVEGILKIRKLTFQGAEFDGRLAGAIDFTGDPAAADVSLEGAVKPHAALLAQLKRTLPESIMARSGKTGEFEFLLSGSIKNPRYSLR